MGVASVLKHAWNAFLDKSFERRMMVSPGSYGGFYSSRPDSVRYRYSNERSIVSAVYTRIAVDASLTDIRHVRTDNSGRYVDDIKSDLNDCLTVSANIDQPSTFFKRNIFTGMMEYGVVAIVPVDADLNPGESASFSIKTMRIGEIIEWFPKHVRVRLYNDAEDKGIKEDIVVEKKFVAIVENPLYNVMNESNSTLQRLIRKLNILDAIDDQSGAGKLDIIIQLPYVIKSEARRAAAEQRRKEIEFQLTGSKYGIAYADATEKITQLNRPAENNLLNQVEYLTEMLYGQLGITKEVMNGTADEKAMVNYYNRTIDPMVLAVVESMRVAFLTKTGRSQGQSIMYFKDMFKFAPLSTIAEIADKLARNEIASSNELRSVLGMRPSKDPKADQLINSNMPSQPGPVEEKVQNGDSQNGS